MEETNHLEHGKFVRILKDYLEEKGYSVKTEHTKEYGGFKADVEALKGKENLCIEVVNGKSIDSLKNKWQAISGNRECDFCLFVPKNKVERVQNILKEWSVYYRKIWIYEDN